MTSPGCSMCSQPEEYGRTTIGYDATGLTKGSLTLLRMEGFKLARAPRAGAELAGMFPSTVFSPLEGAGLDNMPGFMIAAMFNVYIVKLEISHLPSSCVCIR